MFSKKVTYKNFNGDKKSRVLYFHLKKTTLLELEVSKDGGYKDFLIRVSQESRAEEIWKEFTKMIRLAYGEVSDDGEHFVQTPEIVEKFVQSAAYDSLMMELISNADKAAEFFSNLFPDVDKEKFVSQVDEKVKEIQAEDADED